MQVLNLLRGPRRPLEVDAREFRVLKAPSNNVHNPYALEGTLEDALEDVLMDKVLTNDIV